MFIENSFRVYGQFIKMSSEALDKSKKTEYNIRELNI